jgi:uncharacterized phage protein (TIGR02218 family)
MRSVNSAFWLALQRDHVPLAELIELTAPGATFRWTTANAPLQVGSFTYDPFPGASRDGAEESTDLGIGTIDFAVVNSGSLTSLMMAHQLDNAPLVVSRVLTNSPDLGRLYVFRGKLGDINYDRNVIAGQARNLFNGVNGRWPYFTYQDTCVWKFGGTGCGVNINSYMFTSSISVTSSNPLVLWGWGVSSRYTDAQLDRGRLTITSGVNSGQLRSIRGNKGDAVILSHALPYPVEACTFQVYPGCRKRPAEDCQAKYNNINRFLGFPWIPRTEQAF